MSKSDYKKELNGSFDNWLTSHKILIFIFFISLFLFNFFIFVPFRPGFLKVKNNSEQFAELKNIMIAGFKEAKEWRTKQDSINKSLKLISDHIPDISLLIPQTDIKGVSTKYGEMRKDSTGKVEIHYGIDIRANSGTNVYAIASGIVKIAGSDDGWGNRILTNCQNGYEYSIAHFSKLFVVKGEIIYKGELIGLIGSTGNSSGPHADVRIYYNGKPVNTNLFF
jgi:murein DD-endopeptidase MepM/ murein hydrolase activator NlpD